MSKGHLLNSIGTSISSVDCRLFVETGNFQQKPHGEIVRPPGGGVKTKPVLFFLRVPFPEDNI